VAAGGASADMVRQKILETIKRGIAENTARADLGDGERRMLEHMRLYVMETKVAESQLSDEEQATWEAMKSQYLSEQTKAREPRASESDAIVD
jgi:hypothetical protein